MSLLNTYINDVKTKKITNHREALKHYQVRYMSFNNQNFPKDCSLPTCTLAEFGFYFDEKKSIKCYECDFKYDELNQDSLFLILHKHLKHKPRCSQVLSALETIIYDSMSQQKNEIESLMEIDEQQQQHPQIYSKSSAVAAVVTKVTKNLYANEDVRFQTFENVKMLLNARTLAENGFFMLSKEPQTNSSLSKSKSSNSIQSSSNNINPTTPTTNNNINNNSNSNSISNQEDSNTIEKIASLVPALIHIKCAFCTYECLIFKNSVLNTMYKSPLEEHWEKSNNTCFIFTESRFNKFSPVKSYDNNNNNINSENKNLDWLQCLLDFDQAETTTGTTTTATTSSSISSPKKVIDILVTNQNDLNKKTDDLTVKQIPKVIDQLVINEKNKLQNSGNYNTGLKDQKGDNVLYVPKSASKGPTGPTTSDFSKLQNVLHLSDNVISEKAIHPAYTLYQTRVDSFKEWPATLSQQPADLAKAGFYYFGIKDMVKCFFCNGGLKNWDHNDDPYEDHVRWFPKCQFIRQLMGAEFVETVKEKYKNQDSGFVAAENSSSSNYNDHLSLNRSQNYGASNKGGVGGGQAGKSKRSVSPRTLNSRLDTNIIRRMLDTIHPITKESIKQSIEIQLSNNLQNKSFATAEKKNASNSSSSANIYGDDFKSPIEMAKLAIEIERNKTEKIETFKSISDFIICYIHPKINIENIQNFMLFKYNVYPNHVRILREKGSTDRCFALVSLNKKNENSIDEIVKDLNQQNSLLNKNDAILAFRTVWNEFEEKIKPLLNKPTTVSNIMEPVQETAITENRNTNSTNNSNSNNNENNDPLKLSNQSQELNDTEMNLTKEQINKLDIINSNNNKETMVIDDKNVLIEENERLKSERLCVICLSKDKNVLFLPCAHLAACLDCSFNLQNCPICRSKIQATVRTYS